MDVYPPTKVLFWGCEAFMGFKSHEWWWRWWWGGGDDNGNDDHAILIHNEKIATHWLFSSLQTLSWFGTTNEWTVSWKPPPPPPRLPKNVANVPRCRIKITAWPLCCWQLLVGWRPLEPQIWTFRGVNSLVRSNGSKAQEENRSCHFLLEDWKM